MTTQLYKGVQFTVLTHSLSNHYAWSTAFSPLCMSMKGIELIKRENLFHLNRMVWFLYFNDISREVHIFPKGINRKVNVMVQVEFKLVYYDVIVQFVSHYTMGGSPNSIGLMASTGLIIFIHLLVKMLCKISITEAYLATKNIFVEIQNLPGSFQIDQQSRMINLS